MHAYTYRLQSMPPDALLRTVLTDDRCRYWPEYFTPLTNLRRASADVGPSTYRPIDPCTAGLWTHPQLTYFPSPTPSMLTAYWELLLHLALSDAYVFVSYLSHAESHFRLYSIRHTGKLLMQGCAKGIDQTQALC